MNDEDILTAYGKINNNIGRNIQIDLEKDTYKHISNTWANVKYDYNSDEKQFWRSSCHQNLHTDNTFCEPEFYGNITELVCLKSSEYSGNTTLISNNFVVDLIKFLDKHTKTNLYESNLNRDIYHSSGNNLYLKRKILEYNEKYNKYIEVTLPIIIPTNASLDHRALHFDDLSSTTRSYKPYEKLKTLYDQGLRFFGVTEKKHGHHPEYENLDKPRAADSIKHSEQALALYLYEEPHVQALVNQLVLKLHQLGDSVKAGDSVKVIAIALHFHSSKTPCAVCETVLTGLMDRENGAFLQRFKDILSKNQAIFKFRMPKKGIRLHVLYSADDTDADHKENRHQYITNIINSLCEINLESFFVVYFNMDAH